jgi:hypothetical protein
MIDDEETMRLQELLAAHRDTLAILLRQVAIHTEAYAPPAQLSGMADARAQIARLKAALRAAGVAVDDRPGDRATQDDAGRPHVPTAPARTQHVLLDTIPDDDAHIDGVAVGKALARLVYGRDAEENERRRLVGYLARLANRLARLPLRGVATWLDDGPGVSLPQVYVAAATAGLTEIGAAGGRAASQYFQGGEPSAQLKPEYTLDWALPAVAVAAVMPATSSKRLPEAPLLLRLRLVSEAVREHPRLVLLGDSGVGKSIFLRHLAWALAQHGLDQRGAHSMLAGWEDAAHLVPLLLPLRTLAARIATAGASMATVSAALRDELAREYDLRDADGLLDKALAGGTALLLLDGLDEVPRVATPGVSADRRTTLEVVRAFAELHAQARVVVTCRARAYDDTLRASLGWPSSTIAPFTLGQIRHFVAGWFAALVAHGTIGRDLGAARQALLLDAIAGSDRLRALAENPLLLTMMALVLAAQGELQRDRPLLYERILEQLRDEQSLAETIAEPGWGGERIRPLLDQLSFQAHAHATSADGRGRLARLDMRDALEHFLIQAGMRDDHAAAASVRYLAYLVERSGLLIPEDDGRSFAFAHLTLQEHCAGRHMLLAPNAVELVMRHRGDTHWREPIALGIGVLHKLYPSLADRIDRILTELIDPDESGAPKPRERWYRDIILAAELGQEREWSLLRAQINVDRLQRDLRRGLVALLQDPAQPLPIAERVRAGFLLGELGDPRFPISVGEWRVAIDGARAGTPGGYFCSIPAATGEPERWIGRFPITNAQLREWEHTAQLPPRRQETDANFNRPNQPAAGLSWHLASAFCAWLSAETGVTIRLPSEAEWEAAARGTDQRRYPWGDRRLRDHAATKEDHELRAWPYTVPVGCYPAGVSAVGALDMVGNTWEWTADRWRPDGESEPAKQDEQRRALRGGGFLSKKKQMLATARIGLAPGVRFDNGFRVVLEIAASGAGE